MTTPGNIQREAMLLARAWPTASNTEYLHYTRIEQICNPANDYFSVMLRSWGGRTNSQDRRQNRPDDAETHTKEGVDSKCEAIRFINRPDERWALLLRLAVFLALAALPLFVRVFVKRDFLVNLVDELILRSILIYFGLALAALHLASSLIAARFRRCRLSALWEIAVLMPYAALAIFSGFGATVTGPPRPAPQGIQTSGVLSGAAGLDQEDRLAVTSIHNLHAQRGVVG